jgi:hypothetical protein
LYEATHADRRGGVLGREACPSVLADRVLRPAPNGSFVKTSVTQRRAINFWTNFSAETPVEEEAT